MALSRPSLCSPLPVGVALVLLASLSSVFCLGPPPQFFPQWQDHFDGTNTNTWMQAYYVNDTFWQPNSSAPVFLCVGGEGPPIDGSAVVSSVHCNVAVEMLPTTKAIMFAVEHRYYGCHNMSACPVNAFNDQSALKYLSSRQALADLASFHAYATQKYGLTAQNKWISFGGSYPGMLAGWFRLKFPHLVHASVASSAPVQAVVDMVGYYDVVAQAYAVADNGVGGSDACRQAIAVGHKTIGSLFNSTSGRSRLASLFGKTADWYSSASNQAEFAGYGVAYFPGQDNDPSCTDPACNILRICQVMVNTSVGDEVDRLAKIRQQQSLWAEKLVDRIGGAYGHANRLSPRRLMQSPQDLPDFWGWQVCTEFGFFQTCEVGSQCFFTQGYGTLASQMDYCTTDYKISTDKISSNIDESNNYYGGWSSHGSCIMYPNGEVDPWHAQSILNTTNPNIKTLWVPGASHHAWTHPSAPTDQPSVVAARQTIRQYVLDILNQYC
eukprot:m.193365 g.193365  ORF g.193365 m.193365 type:complete len:495 (-) comp16779_c8_seq4:201-1685(-)